MTAATIPIEISGIPTSNIAIDIVPARPSAAITRWVASSRFACAPLDRSCSASKLNAG